MNNLDQPIPLRRASVETLAASQNGFNEVSLYRTTRLKKALTGNTKVCQGLKGAISVISHCTILFNKVHINFCILFSWEGTALELCGLSNIFAGSDFRWNECNSVSTNLTRICEDNKTFSQKKE